MYQLRKTLMILLVSAAMVSLGITACTKQKVEVEKYASTNFQGIGKCQIDDFDYFGQAHNIFLDSIFAILSKQVQQTGNKLTLENAAQVIYNESMRCATQYQQTNPSISISLNPNFPHIISYSEFLSIDSYEKYKEKATQIINNSNRFTQQQKPLLNQLMTAIDTCTTEETFRGQIASIENQICSLPIAQRPEIFKVISVAKNSSDYWFSSKFDDWKGIIDMPTSSSKIKLPKWLKCGIKIIGADCVGALYGGLGGAIADSGKAVFYEMINAAITSR